MRVDSSFLKVRVEWVNKYLQSKEEAHRHLAQILKFGARSIPSRPHGRFVGRVAAWLLGYCFDKLSAKPFLGHALVRQLPFLALNGTFCGRREVEEARIQ